MTGQQLKNAILALAVQGKLVPQDPKDEPASELLKRIATEKARLVAEGKIKKEKPLPEITDEEKPFEIPAGWEWGRWGNLSDSIQYGYNAPAKKNGTVKMVRISDIQNNRILWDTVPYCDIKETEIETYRLEKNDILFARTGGTVGKSYLVSENSERAIYAGYLIRTRYNQSLLVPQYLKFFMESHIYWAQLRNGTIATAQPNCNGKTLSQMLIPLPPLTEQKRIVAKIEELLPLIDAYDEAEQKLSALDADFPDKLKKSILQQAVQGKLAKQDKNDEPASELLKRIKAEKERLIAEGKIKKEKPLPPITEEEKPFALPEGWEWARLGNCVSIRGGKRMPKGTELTKNSTKHIYIRVTDMQHGTILDNDLHYVPDEVYPSIAQYIIKEEDVYIVIVGSTIGKTGLVPAKFHEMNLTENAARLTPIIIKKEWLYRVLDSELLQQQVLDKTKQVGQPKLAIARLRSAVIPIPPFAEQRRIVEQVEEYLDLCDKLKKNL